jgi:hypothetical protein
MKLVVAQYQDLEVSFSEDGWFNATVAAEKFGKLPNEWLRLPNTIEYLEALERKYGIIPHYITKKGKNGGTWLSPRLAVLFARWLDIDFAIWCDEQIDALIRGQHPHYDWKRVRHEASSSFRVMSAVMQMQRQLQGKSTEPHHYVNESRLVNWALTGEFKKVDRDGLSFAELDLLAKLEERDAVLLGCGLAYDDRKLALERFAVEWRTPLLESAA